MNEESKRFDLLTRLAAYSGCSLRFGIHGFVDNEAVLSSVTHLHHIPAGKTLLEVAEHIHEVLIDTAEKNYECPPGIRWITTVTPGVCLN